MMQGMIRSFTVLTFLMTLSLLTFAQGGGKAELQITLTDGQKNPLSDKTIVVVSEQEEAEFKGKTNEEGQVTINVPKGDRYQVVYRAVDGPVKFKRFKIPDREGRLTFKFTARYQKGNQEVYTLDNVYFDTDKATLRESSNKALNNLYQALATNPDMKIEVAGHTDNRGEAEYNRKLSQRRAESVKQYLVDKGISAERIRAKGYGESEPVATNETKEGRQQNRRTEVRILEE